MTTTYRLTLQDDDEINVFDITVPAFDIITGAQAILSAISNLPKEAKQKKPRPDRRQESQKAGKAI